MGCYVGVDFGSSMLKAAAVGDLTARPELLLLGRVSPFLPAAVKVRNEKAWAVGEEPFLRRRRDADRVAYAFRDRLESPEASILVGSKPVAATPLMQVLLGGVGRHIQHAAPAPVAALAIAAPDHWNASRWTLPVALRKEAWNPIAVVREWTTVVSTLDALDCQEALLISLGYGAARATHCTLVSDAWQANATVVEAGLSGQSLRERIGDEMSEAVVRALRKNPREDDAADQALHDSIECALRELTTSPESQVAIQQQGRAFEHTLTRDSVAELVASWQSRLERLCERIAGDSPERRGACPILVWGELVHLLPIERWLSGLLSRHTRLITLPLDVVASGTARLCAAMSQAPGSFPESCFSWLGADGAHLPAPPVAERGLRLLERLPAAWAPAVAAGVCRLTLVGPAGHVECGKNREVLTPRFRLGRSRNSDWTFDADLFPTVSGAHAELVQDGGAWMLCDLESTNGTFLNETELRKAQPLANGDIIGLGTQGPRLRFDLTD